VIDEIALNPQHFASRKTTEVLATLTHEMVHLWQHHKGQPPRKGYHDRQWAGKMKEIGLWPTDTGQLGGKETGQRVSQLIQKMGPFGRAVDTLLRERPAILFQDLANADDPIRKKKTESKTKYTCPTCGLNAWAKPAAPLVCGNCHEDMKDGETLE
jgi:hypothetical protein